MIKCELDVQNSQSLYMVHIMYSKKNTVSFFSYLLILHIATKAISLISLRIWQGGGDGGGGGWEEHEGNCVAIISR